MQHRVEYDGKERNRCTGSTLQDIEQFGDRSTYLTCKTPHVTMHQARMPDAKVTKLCIELTLIAA